MKKDKKEIVSICIPTYNTGQYIERTLRSIMNQSYKNMEIIVGDNVSTDDTEEVVKRLQEEDARIKYYKNEKNIGGVANFNKLVEMAQSEYVAIYHSDDIYEPIIVEKQMKVLLKNPEIKGVFSKLRRFTGEDASLEKRDYGFLSQLKKKENYYYGCFEDYFPLFLLHNSFLPCPSFMGRKSFYQKVGGFREKYIQATDLDLWLTMLKHGGTLAILDEILLNYRIHDQQDSFNYRSPDRLEQNLFFTLMDDYMKESSLKIAPKTLKMYKAQKVIDLLEVAYNYYKKNNLEKSREVIEHTKKEYVFPVIFYEGLVQKFPSFIRKDKFWVVPFFYGGKLLKKTAAFILKKILYLKKEKK